MWGQKLSCSLQGSLPSGHMFKRYCSYLSSHSSTASMFQPFLIFSNRLNDETLQAQCRSQYVEFPTLRPDDEFQLMAVPKRKVTPSRRGKRNGPKALKAVPLILKCSICGRVKLQHQFCCDGTGAQKGTQQAT